MTKEHLVDYVAKLSSAYKNDIATLKDNLGMPLSTDERWALAGLTQQYTILTKQLDSFSELLDK